jgi:hypothetical protein
MSSREKDTRRGEGCRSPEGSVFAAEEGYEEGGPNAEEGHEEVWDEVQEALSTMVHEDYDETVLCTRSQASLITTRPSQCARSQASRPSSSTSSRASGRS